jgi:beta-lactamase class A
VLIKQIIDRTTFDGLTDIYVLDLENQKEMTLAYDQGKEYPSGIAFSAASTIKIPIMVSIFKTLPEPLPQNASDLLQIMIEKSGNDQADQLMQTYLDKNLGPKILTENTIRPLGLQNTFMAGYFKLGSLLLIRYPTPANTRTDFNTSPDPYNQTTTIDMGMLLDDIYLCAKTGGGTFAAVFPDEITQTECQMMVTLLTGDKNAVLLQAGLPDGTRFAHKHGWVVETDGLMHSIEDAGIVFSPGGDYIIAISMYQPTQLIFDIANPLAAKISTAVYNYFNITG